MSRARVLLALVTGLALVGATTVVVRAAEELVGSSSETWRVGTGGQAEVVWEEGPEVCGEPTLGEGSVGFVLTDASVDATRLSSTELDGTRLDELSELGYATCAAENEVAQWPVLLLSVDHDADGAVDDQLIFDPAYQGFNGSVSCFDTTNLSSPSAGEWQEWDAANGCWWSRSEAPEEGEDPEVFPLGDVTDEHPDAAVVARADGLGGFWAHHGNGDEAGANTVHVDAVTWAVGDEEARTFDFESDGSASEEDGADGSGEGDAEG